MLAKRRVVLIPASFLVQCLLLHITASHCLSLRSQELKEQRLHAELYGEGAPGDPEAGKSLTSPLFD